MEEEEGGFQVISEYICEHCKSPWIKQQAEGTCMACGKTGSHMPMTKDKGLTQEVDGITWNLQLTEKGITWNIQPKSGETPDEEQEASMKIAASINVADFSVPLKPPQINQEISYSDLVPNNQRVLLGDQVIEEEIDDPLFSSTNMEDRPALKKEYRDGQQALFFHPQATKALRLRTQIMEDPPEKMADEEEGLHAVQAMQEGAQSLSHEEARGAEVLRHLSISKLQGYLKRKHEGDSGSGGAWQRIALAQTSLSEAKTANKEFQEQGRHKRNTLRPAVNDRDDLWSPQAQTVLESNALMPSVIVDFLSEDDISMARTLHLDMKTYIKNKGNPCPGSMLLEEVPETPLDFWEAT